jgi:low temperature requirement protein LtrA
MLLLALLAVFTADATHGSGTQFAIVYCLFLMVIWWQWFTVRLQDTEEYMAATRQFLIALAISIGLMAASVFATADVQLLLWTGPLVLWVGYGLILSRDQVMDTGVTATDSMVERFGLFVIIVLGEVVVGVVAGLSEVVRSPTSIATGLIGLCIGFAYWWTYFDFVGRRLPVDTGQIRTRWMFTHLPVTLSIAAAGAAMVSLIEHAGDDHTPLATAWLLAGSVALGLVALVFKIRTLRDFERLPAIYRPVSGAMVVAAGLALLTPLWAPVPWLFALTLVLILGLVWLFAVDRWLRLPDPASIQPQGGSG